MCCEEEQDRGCGEEVQKAERSVGNLLKSTLYELTKVWVCVPVGIISRSLRVYKITLYKETFWK